MPDGPVRPPGACLALALPAGISGAAPWQTARLVAPAAHWQGDVPTRQSWRPLAGATAVARRPMRPELVKKINNSYAQSYLMGCLQAGAASGPALAAPGCTGVFLLHSQAGHVAGLATMSQKIARKASSAGTPSPTQAQKYRQ